MPHYRSDIFVNTMEWLVHILPEISLCEQAKARKALLSDDSYGNAVVRISEKIAVKYGYGVTSGEAATQQYAYQNLNQQIVKVPRVYRYFEDKSKPSWPKGYLFKEYIPGKSLEDLDLKDTDIYKRLAHVVMELSSVQGGTVPGQIDGGTLQGYLWGDDGTKNVFNTVEDMNHWINTRIRLINKEIDLRPYPLVLCHLDLCRRNIKLMEDDSICLLDWGHSGFFPRFYEIAAVECSNDTGDYSKSLYNAIAEEAKLTEDEQKCVWLILRARAGALRFVL
ncbi:Phosphotransferase enzyme family protein [Trichophyton equinum CBS 127.97]|uniref:Phosphotransferase enzyme family protein n=1 Tax=Trichophyton equinum (strain ATCC MYA-4606 / CBS 127.97) TaxID=559882 RepID=F2Q5D2_TRIEC|nr:Phosphotransferase enzyme family protein [Trichophyton equinum CBS 127.97]